MPRGNDPCLATTTSTVQHREPLIGTLHITFRYVPGHRQVQAAPARQTQANTPGDVMSLLDLHVVSY